MKNIFLLFFSIFSMQSMAQDNQLKTDWANTKRYAEENKNLKAILNGKKPVVFMGNSITEGWKDNDSSFFINNFYVDRGISGQTTSQMLVRFRQDVIALKPAVVVILAGINDIAENNGPIALEDIFANIVSMAELAKMNKIKVILTSVLPANVIPWRTDIKPAEKVIALNAMIEDYCKKNRSVFLNYYPKMVDDKKGLDRKFSEDGVHPNLAGYKIMEPLAQEAIKLALKQK